jgi:hypothetical protein
MPRGGDTKGASGLASQQKLEDQRSRPQFKAGPRNHARRGVSGRRSRKPLSFTQASPRNWFVGVGGAGARCHCRAGRPLLLSLTVSSVDLGHVPVMSGAGLALAGVLATHAEANTRQNNAEMDEPTK